jgi:hypothetical protein
MLTPRRFFSVALVGVIGAGVVLWLWPPPGPITTRTIPTGAGFTVAVSQLPTEPQARTIAARIAASGLPAFTRSSGASYQVVAGPYVSVDEADAAQRFLAKRGFRARVLVDESVRRPPGYDGKPVLSAAANVLLISGAGSLAIVIEMADEPRHVATSVVNQSELAIVAGPVASRVEPVRWKAPAGVKLLRYVSIDEAVAGNGRSLRARVTTPRSAQATVRTAGRRIYIDLVKSAPLPQPEELPATTVLTKGPAFAKRFGEAGREQVSEDYRVTIAPVIERLEAIEPFVMSAVSAPATDVMNALERSLRALEAWADQVTPPGRWRQSHEFLVSAVTKAADSVSAGFAGDRTVKAREAFALRDAAKRSLGAPDNKPSAAQ